jgi:hypothetical protein
MPSNLSGDADVNGSGVEVVLTDDSGAQGGNQPPGDNNGARDEGDTRQGGGRQNQRIASVTYRLRESERKRVATENRLARLEGVIATQNQQRDVDGKRQVAAQRLASYEGHVVDLDRRVSDAAKNLRLAEENGEENSVSAAREVHIEAVAERRAARAETARMRGEFDAAPAPTAPAPQPGSKDPTFDAWRQSNPWFDGNPKMRATAMAVHNQIKTDGSVPVGSDEYYRAIDSAVMDEYPDDPAFSDEGPADPAPAVGAPLGNGGDVRPSRGGSQRVRLTAEQVTAANRMGVPLAEYARNMKG